MVLCVDETVGNCDSRENFEKCERMYIVKYV
jgi:hypothetical protein